MVFASVRACRPVSASYLPRCSANVPTPSSSSTSPRQSLENGEPGGSRWRPRLPVRIAQSNFASGGFSRGFLKRVERSRAFESDPLVQQRLEAEEVKDARNQRVHGSGLERLAWDRMKLVPFRKSFYVEHPAVAARTEEEQRMLLKELDCVVTGDPPLPRAVRTFEEACFPEDVIEGIESAEFEHPSPIQKVGWPIALSGRDMIGIAQTGSGKTLAYGLPAIVHVNAQPPVTQGDSPVVVILAPTRELVLQIERALRFFCRRSLQKTVAVYGGVPRHTQVHRLKQGAEICVATPGRLLEFLEDGTTDLRRVTYLVLDEADCMLDMGFEQALIMIESQIRPNRQTLMWSATWPKRVQTLAREFCKEDPVQIKVGSTKLRANPDVLQRVVVVPEIDKDSVFFEWLDKEGRGKKLLVFVGTKLVADTLSREIRTRGFRSNCFHSDKDQASRDEALQEFRAGRTQILVATDIASRGMHIDNIDCVVNYDMPLHIATYVHRIGRTARAGAKGESFSLFEYDSFSPTKVRMARDLQRIMHTAGQVPPSALVDIAMSGSTNLTEGLHSGRARF
mmetsp:Transcript_92258/g.246681  ORF Transcript_92258/g.246681 Transcript_92258/m.246681 type:complete len:566 (+) Transcript_92258:21-1718(+)